MTDDQPDHAIVNPAALCVPKLMETHATHGHGHGHGIFITENALALLRRFSVRGQRLRIFRTWSTFEDFPYVVNV